MPQIEHKAPQLRYDVIEANFYSGTLADAYGMDVLDLHFQFRFSLHHRMKDGVHWNAVAHRKITSLLLQHAAEAWGVILPCPVTVYGERKSGVTRTCRKIFCTSRIKCGLLVFKLSAGFEVHLFSPYFFFLGVDHTEVAEEQPTYNSAPKHTSKMFYANFAETLNTLIVYKVWIMTILLLRIL